MILTTGIFTAVLSIGFIMGWAVAVVVLKGGFFDDFNNGGGSMSSP